MAKSKDHPVSEHPDPAETVDTNAGADAVQGTVAGPDGFDDAKGSEVEAG